MELVVNGAAVATQEVPAVRFEIHFVDPGAHMGSQAHDLKQLEETLATYPNFYVDTAARHRVFGRLNPPAVRAFFEKHQDRILFGTDGAILQKGRKKPAESANISLYPTENPDLVYVDPKDSAALNAWQTREAQMFSESLKYFETDRVDLLDPMCSGGSWWRTSSPRSVPLSREQPAMPAKSSSSRSSAT